MFGEHQRRFFILAVKHGSLNVMVQVALQTRRQRTAVPESTLNSYKTLLEDKCEDICLKPNMQRKYQWGNNPQLRSKSTKDVLKKGEETQGGLVKESQ